MAARLQSSWAVMGALVALAASPAQAQEPAAVEEISAGPEMPEPYGPPPIPPAAEAQPVTGAGGSYCYGGPHPVDPRAGSGGPWDDTPGPHEHFYPPFDMRLFTYENGCYYFVGD